MEFAHYSEEQFARAQQRLIKEGLISTLENVKNKLFIDRAIDDIWQNPDEYLYYCDLDLIFPKEKALSLVGKYFMTIDELHMIYIVWMYYTQYGLGKLFNPFLRNKKNRP